MSHASLVQNALKMDLISVLKYLEDLKRHEFQDSPRVLRGSYGSICNLYRVSEFMALGFLYLVGCCFYLFVCASTARPGHRGNNAICEPSSRARRPLDQEHELRTVGTPALAARRNKTSKCKNAAFIMLLLMLKCSCG